MQFLVVRLQLPHYQPLLLLQYMRMLCQNHCKIFKFIVIYFDRLQFGFFIHSFMHSHEHTEKSVRGNMSKVSTKYLSNMSLIILFNRCSLLSKCLQSLTVISATKIHDKLIISRCMFFNYKSENISFRLI